MFDTIGQYTQNIYTFMSEKKYWLLILTLTIKEYCPMLVKGIHTAEQSKIRK